MLRPDASRARIIWAAASLLLVVGVFVSLLQAGAAQRRRDAQATARAEATAEGVLLPLLTGGDISRPVTDPRYSQLADQIEGAILDAGPAEHVKVWRPDATIVFSTEEDQVGTKVPGLRERLSAALDEGTQTIVEGGRFRALVPLTSKSGSQVVAELDEPYGPIWSGANWPWRTLAFVLGFATLVAIGMLAASFRAGRAGGPRSDAEQPAEAGPRPAPAPAPVGEEPRPAATLEQLRPATAEGGGSDPHPDLAAEVEARRKAEERVLDAEGRAERVANELRLIEQEAKRIDAERESAATERDTFREEVARLRAQLVRAESERRDVDPAALEQAEARLKQAEELAQERVRVAEERAALAEAGIDDHARAAEERAAAAETELSDLRSRTGVAETQLLEIQAELEGAQERLGHAEQARTEAQALIHDTETRVQAAENLVRDAEARAGAAEQRAAGAEERATAAEQRLEELRAQDGAVTEEAQRLRQLLTAAERMAETAEVERKEIEEREAGSQRQLAALRAQVTELQSQLARPSGPDPDAERRMREAEERTAQAEQRAAQAEQELIAIQVEGSVGEDERQGLAEAIADAERRARDAEAMAQEAEAKAQEAADREGEFQREVARLHSELEETRAAGPADPDSTQRAAELEEQLAMVRGHLEASEAHAERLARELRAREAIAQVSPNGEGTDLEQMLRISQERLAVSAEALQRAEARSYEAEKELKRLKALEDEAEARFRQGKLEQALREMAGVEPAPEGAVLEDRRASGPFKAAVALDAKNSLTSILGLVMTLKHKDAAPEQQTLLRRLSQQARRLDHLVADLLDADRLARGEVELVRRRTDLDALVRRVVDESGLAAERQITIQSEPLTASVSAPRVEQILTTLLATVADRTKPGAKVWVVVQPEEEGVVLAVEDEHAASDAAVSPVVTRFADLHGGWTKVESREGGGSSFRVFFPDPAPDTSENPAGQEVDLTEGGSDAAAEVDAGRAKS